MCSCPARKAIRNRNVKTEFATIDAGGATGAISTDAGDSREALRVFSHAVALYAWTAMLLFALLDAVAVRLAGLNFVDWHVSIGVVAFALVIFAYGWIRRIDQLADLGQFSALWLVFSVLVTIFTYCAATSGYPLRDAGLARFDGMLGLDWTKCFTFICEHPIISYPLGKAYSSMLLQVFLTVLFLSHTRRRARNEEFIYIALIAGLITTVCSIFTPAVGPYLDVPPPWSRTLLEIRSGATTFAITRVQGIVCMPSYHTVIAILLIYAHRPPARTFFPALIVNITMLAAIPFAGHHYLADVFAGAAVVAVTIAIVRTAMAARLNSLDD